MQIRTGEGDDLAQILIGSTANPLPNQAINLHINADGEGGNDELALLLSLPAVQGQLGAQLRGGSGDDRLALVGQNLSLRRNFLLHGGTGQDACFASDDVRVLACESHGALESLTSFGDVLQRLDSSLKELFA